MSNTTQKSALSEKAMLVRHSIRAWSGRAVDLELTQKIGTDHNTQGEWGSVSKILVAGKHLERIKSITSKARQHHVEMTLPWEDAGVRVLPTRIYIDYMKVQGDFKAQYESAVEDFLRDYDDAVDEAQVRLGSMFRPSDYPGTIALRRKFEFAVSVTNVPDSRDFRVDLGKSEIAKIQADVESRMRNVMMDGTTELFTRLHAAVDHMVTMLDDDGRRIHESLIKNMAGLVQVLPKMNIEGDPELDRIIGEIGAKLTTSPAKDLKADPELRKKKASDAKAILDSLGAYVN